MTGPALGDGRVVWNLFEIRGGGRRGGDRQEGVEACGGKNAIFCVFLGMFWMIGEEASDRAEGA